MSTGDSNTIQNHAAFIWSVADLLRGDYKQSEYGRVILPLTVLWRLDCVLEPTKQAVLDRAEQLAGKVDNLDPILEKKASEPICTSPLVNFAQQIAETTTWPTTSIDTPPASPSRFRTREIRTRPTPRMRRHSIAGTPSNRQAGSPANSGSMFTARAGAHGTRLRSQQDSPPTRSGG